MSRVQGVNHFSGNPHALCYVTSAVVLVNNTNALLLFSVLELYR